MSPLAIKTCGYLVSTVSVILLATVAWPGASKEPLLATALVVGATASVVGMGLRWLSYWIEERRKAEANEPA
jgi:biotin transporter BioY